MEDKLKKLQAPYFNVLREAVAFINANNIQKEDIVSILKEGEGIVVLYYK